MANVNEAQMPVEAQGCQCEKKECKCEKVAKCAYRVVKVGLKVASLCALFRIGKELHKVHKAIKHASRHEH